jgi:hypothetical protein
MTALADDDVKPMENPSQPHLSKQDITKLDLNQITALTQEVVSLVMAGAGTKYADWVVHASAFRGFVLVVPSL